MPENAHSVVLHRAAEELGGADFLGTRLRVPLADLKAWMGGTGKPPMPVFLEALEIGMARLRRLHRHCEALRLASRRALEQAQRIRDLLAADMLETILDRALCATGADMGNVQLLRPEGLRIVAQRGFQQPFLDYFARVDDERSACGAALRGGRRIAISDVQSDPMFTDTPAEPVMAKATVRAVQSTPLLTPAGMLVGVLSTHYALPHSLTPREEETLDRMARQAALWLGPQPAPMEVPLLGTAG
jgi:hypothetical protein